MKNRATLSIDLDNLWAYIKAIGDPAWEGLPSYFKTCIPAILDLLDQRRLKATFFIVGQDAKIASHHELLKEIACRGHEIANHSYHHNPDLKIRSAEEIEAEIAAAEEAIFQATGERPIGFRGPGFAWSETILQILEKRGYRYDSSLLPSIVSPFARLYFSKTTGTKNRYLYGGLKEAFYPSKNQMIDLKNGRKIYEMPVTTIPWIKTPFHLSYLVYLYGLSPAIMRNYLRFAVAACRWTATSPNFLIHPTDLFCFDALNHFPGMQISPQIKTALFHEVIDCLSESFTLGTLKGALA